MSKWFAKYRYSKNARLRIFCFPYAGGSASVFNGWQDYFDNHIDLFAIQAPGRETRFNEEPIKDVVDIVNTLLEEMLPFCNVPYIFIGHSNGALTAFELARKLQTFNNFNLEHIFLSAKRAPHLLPIKPPVHNLPYEEFIKELKSFSTIPHEVINDQEMMEVFMPMLRADFGLGERHLFNHRHKLRANATLFWGSKDKDVPEEDVLAWSDHIIGNVNGIVFNGGHFFIHNEKEKFIKEINILAEKIMQNAERFKG